MALVGAIAVAGLTTVSGYYSNKAQIKAQNRQLEYQSQVAAANAAALWQKAEQEAQAGAIEAERIAASKSEATRKYKTMQGEVTSLLAGSGVDLSSASSQSLLDSNAILYAQDVADIDYQRRLSEWSTKNTVASTTFQARQQESAADYYMKSKQSTKGLFGRSLLQGLASGVGAYAMFGGSFNKPNPGAGTIAGSASKAGNLLGTAKQQTGFVTKAFG